MSTDNERGTKVLRNGAVYDMGKHRIVANPGGGTTAITKQTASDMAEIRRQRKQQLLEAGAASAVQRGDLRLAHGDDAWIVEIGSNMQVKATTQDDPKAVEAARFLFQETGRAEARTQAHEQAPVSDTVAAVLLLLDRLERYRVDYVDAQARDADADREGG